LTQLIKRIGFACKFSELNSKKEIVSIPELNTSGTTISWLNRQTREVAEQKLWDMLEKNITNTYNLVKRVGLLKPELRMVRLTSDILIAFTHANWEYFYKKPDVLSRIETLFAKVGDAARAADVRLSFHPGQFTVLASINEGIVINSIKEFEYHASMANWMGFGRRFQDLKINVHISGKQGPEGIRSAYKRLSPEARNCITIENEEMSWGLDDCLTLSDLLPIVLDVHHNWIKTGTYIKHDSENTQRVIDSWRGVRPTMHYSVSREDVLIGHSPTTSPDHDALIAAGFNKQKLRAHSDSYWNDEVNQWALSFADNFDIMCESKWKNIASFKLHDTYTDRVNNVQ
jgi:UV DNA damage repair endonuclease